MMDSCQESGCAVLTFIAATATVSWILGRSQRRPTSTALVAASSAITVSKDPGFVPDGFVRHEVSVSAEVID
jgi:hypothetical protein